jgi:hypothetical protein
VPLLATGGGLGPAPAALLPELMLVCKNISHFKSTSITIPDIYLGIAFSGEVSVSNALSESSSIYNKLPGAKYISLGGGDADGRFTASKVSAITNAINNGKFSGYSGIVYDIEEGDSGLASAFKDSFAAAKAKGLKVLVTISNSAPYGISDAGSLMRSFLSNSNIDYISPQLYESGEETSNVYATSGGVAWTEYANAKAIIIPSIVQSGLYSSAQNYFAGKGVTLGGYIQWKQV